MSLFKNKNKSKNTRKSATRENQFVFKQNILGEDVIGNPSRKAKINTKNNRVNLHCAQYFVMEQFQNEKTDKTRNTINNSYGDARLSNAKAITRVGIKDWVEFWYAHNPKTSSCPDIEYTSAPAIDGSSVECVRLPDNEGKPSFCITIKDQPVYLTRVHPKTRNIITEEMYNEELKLFTKQQAGKNVMITKDSIFKYVKRTSNRGGEVTYWAETLSPTSMHFPEETFFGIILGKEVVDGITSEKEEIFLSVSGSSENPFSQKNKMGKTGSFSVSINPYKKALTNLPYFEEFGTPEYKGSEIYLERVPRIWSELDELFHGEHDENDTQPDVLLYRIGNHKFSKTLTKEEREIIKSKTTATPKGQVKTAPVVEKVNL